MRSIEMPSTTLELIDGGKGRSTATRPSACPGLSFWGSCDVKLVLEKDHHWSVLRALLGTSGAAGNLATDAHLAAFALTHDAVLVSCDADFGRFDGLRWENPLRNDR